MNGPIEVKLHHLQIDKAHVEVHYRSKSGLPTIADRLREQIIRNTCESALMTVLYPRSSIFIQIHEMEDAGGVRNYFFDFPVYLLILLFSIFTVDCMCRECIVLSTFKYWTIDEMPFGWCSLRHH